MHTMDKFNRVLVTGAAGFIGSHLVQKLLDENFEVGIIKRSTSDIWRIKNLLRNIKVYDADIRNFKEVDKVILDFKPDVVVHLAYYYAVGPDSEEIIKLSNTNVLGTINLLESSKRNHIKRFINTSTCFVYENCGDNRLNETNNLKPINHYTLTKIQAEQACTYYAENSDLKIITLRIFPPYGPADNERRLIPFLIGSFLNNEKPKLTAGEQKWSFIYVSDIVDAYVKSILILDLPLKHEIFNVGNEQTISIRDIAIKIKTMLGSDVEAGLGELPYRGDELKFICADNNKAKTILKWEPKVGIDEGLKLTADWYKTFFKSNTGFKQRQKNNEPITNGLNKEKEQRQKAYALVEEYYNEFHKKNQQFIPGHTTITHAGRVYDAEEMKYLIDSCLDFWLTAGRFAKQFEEEFAQFLGVNYCILTNSGSSANLLAISALTSPKLAERKLKPGDEVITVAVSFPTTINPIVQNGLVPVFLDVDLGTYNIKTEEIENAITSKTKAIFLAHTLGNPFDIDKIVKLCKKYGLWLIEDNCDALGSQYQGKYTGTFGHIATSSFYPPHHLTMGEGGAVVTNDPLLKKIILSFRGWGRDCWCNAGEDNSCEKRFCWQLGKLPKGYDHKYIYSHLGYNLKITDMQAAVGVAQLKKLPGFIESRKKNWNYLLNNLQKYAPYFILPEATENSIPSWFGFALTVKENIPFTREDIINYLESKKIRTRVLFAGNITYHPSFENVDYRIHGVLKNTDLIMKNTFWIGVYPGITDEMIKYVVGCFDEFIKNIEGK